MAAEPTLGQLNLVVRDMAATLASTAALGS